MTKPTLCVDFDGVIHAYDSPWTTATEIRDGPVPGAFDFLRRASEDFLVAIYSSRSAAPGAIEAMREWFIAHITDAIGVKGTDQVILPSWLEALVWPKTKPAAFLTIDDRAILFNGEWPEPKHLLEFKPWNKREKEPPIAPHIIKEIWDAGFKIVPRNSL